MEPASIRVCEEREREREKERETERQRDRETKTERKKEIVNFHQIERGRERNVKILNSGNMENKQKK